LQGIAWYAKQRMQATKIYDKLMTNNIY